MSESIFTCSFPMNVSDTLYMCITEKLEGSKDTKSTIQLYTETAPELYRLRDWLLRDCELVKVFPNGSSIYKGQGF